MCGKYTDEFEATFSWQPRINMQCNWIRGETEFHTTSRDVQVAVGHSEGHYGSIKHYKKVAELTNEEYMRRYQCSMCGTKINLIRGVDGYGPAPKSCGNPIVTFTSSENRHVLSIKETGSTHTIVCKQPDFGKYSLISAIWEHAGRPAGSLRYVLEQMWKAARQMDQEEGVCLSVPLLDLGPKQMEQEEEFDFRKAFLDIGTKNNPENNEVVSNNKPGSNIVYTVIEKPEYSCCSLQ